MFYSFAWTVPSAGIIFILGNLTKTSGQAWNHRIECAVLALVLFIVL